MIAYDAAIDIFVILRCRCHASVALRHIIFAIAAFFFSYLFRYVVFFRCLLQLDDAAMPMPARHAARTRIYYCQRALYDPRHVAALIMLRRYADISFRYAYAITPLSFRRVDIMPIFKHARYAPLRYTLLLMLIRTAMPYADADIR